MPVILRTIEILARLGALGLPVTLLLLTQIDRVPGRWRVSGRLLLAPVTGLALFAVFSSIFYAIGHPVATAVPWFWCLLAALWLAAILVWWRSTRRRLPFQPGWRTALSHGFVVLGLLLVMGVHLRPFLQNPDLVFWHYAGSDGYFYMRIAEHVGSVGTDVIPTVGPYDASSGFLAADIQHYHEGWFTEKPGTMSTLAGLAALLGVTTHETFSPLLYATLSMLGLGLVVFAQSLLRLPVWAGALIAGLTLLSIPVWLLSSHTFLGNVLALPFYAVIMLAVRPVTSWRTAVYLGLVMAGQMLVFPDGEPALIGALGVAAPFLAWTAWRRRRLLRLLGMGLLTAGTAAVALSPFARVMVATNLSRLHSTLSASQRSALENSTADHAAGNWLHLHPLTHIDWIWGAFNLNTVPPQPLQAAERPYLFAFGGFILLFVVACVLRRQLWRLLPYLLSFFLILGLGLLGVLQSDYELFRALAIFAFVPLAAVCALPWVVAGHGISWRARTLRCALFALLIPLLVHFVRADLYHFNFAFTQHQADAQYTAGDIRDRREIARLGETHSLVAGSETSNFTSMANVVMLFSNSKLGIPEAYHRFFFVGIAQDRSGYTSDLLVRNIRYPDIGERIPAGPKPYASADFEVTANDLEPFFDNDTFLPLHGYSAKFIADRKLPVRRMLKDRTSITFFSREPRTISLVLQFDPLHPPAQLAYAFDAGPVRHASAQDKLYFKLDDFPVTAGLHTVTLGPLDTAAGVEAVRIYAEPITDPVTPLRGGWRTYATLTAAEQSRFRSLSPRPVRFRCDFDPADNDGFLFTHPETRLVFQAEQGRRHVAAVLRLPAGAYENLQPGEATDGVTFEIARLNPDGRREVMFSRHIDPALVPADRGDVASEADFELPPGAEIELSVGPGPAGRNNRDWCSLGNVVIR